MALTDALPFSVNVHVFLLLPPLEHPPDQIASLPFEALKVIDVPEVNDADAVLPALTSKATGCATVAPAAGLVREGADGSGEVEGFTDSVAVPDAPPNEPVILAAVDAVTALVVTVKLALLAPAGMVTVAGTVAALELSESDTTAPPPPSRSTQPGIDEPPVVRTTDCRNSSFSVGGRTVNWFAADAP